MSCSDSRRCIQVVRRFNDFNVMSADMKKDLSWTSGNADLLAVLPEVPRAGVLSLFGSDTNPESSFIRERKQQLENYLKELMGIGAFEKSRSFRRFLLDRYEAWSILLFFAIEKCIHVPLGCICSSGHLHRLLSYNQGYLLKLTNA